MISRLYHLTEKPCDGAQRLSRVVRAAQDDASLNRGSDAGSQGRGFRLGKAIIEKLVLECLCDQGIGFRQQTFNLLLVVAVSEAITVRAPPERNPDAMTKKDILSTKL